MMAIPEVLHGVGVTKQVGFCELTLADRDGSQRKVRVEAVAWPEESRWIRAGSDTVLPAHLSRTNDSYWFQPLAEDNAVYCQFNQIFNKEDEPFADFCERLFAYLDDHRPGRLVIDLRRNGGGEGGLNRHLLDGLVEREWLNQPGRLFTLIGPRTFSAAMMLVVELERETETRFAGEPTGSSPNFVGETLPFTLPNSGLIASVSAVYWQNSSAYDRRTWIAPHIFVETTSEDANAGRDPVLEAVLATESHETAPSGS